MESAAMERVQCRVHGTQDKTYVCQHIADGLIARKRVGFFWTTDDPENPRPDAWCTECNARTKDNGWEWVGEALEHLKPTLLCGACYDLAKQFHMGGNPWA
jgi:hypothetical protein